MTFGLSAATVGLIGAGATLASGVMGAGAASDASAAQAASADKATALQEKIFNQQRTDQAPFREAGLTAQNRLMYLLGLSPQKAAAGGTPAGTTYTAGNGGGQMTASGPQSLQNAPDTNALRTQLLPQFTKGGGARTVSGFDQDTGMPTYNEPASTVDEAGLQAAIAAQQGQAQPGAMQGSQALEPAGTLPDGSPDPAYGSLMQDFTGADFQAGKDPGYQWRLDQGNQALDRSAAARGGLLSGRAMKDAMNYGQGAASQEYGAAFNRFQTNRSNKLNPLQSLMGAGQSATNQVGSAGSAFATNAGDNIIGAGNAQASGIMGGANAIAGGVSGAYNGYQNNQLMNRIWGPTGGGAYSGGGSSYPLADGMNNQYQ